VAQVCEAFLKAGSETIRRRGLVFCSAFSPTSYRDLKTHKEFMIGILYPLPGPPTVE